MAIENFLTYPYTDSGAFLTIAAARVTWTLLDRSTDAYAYRDMGVDYFSGDFVHALTHRSTGGTGGGGGQGIAYPWALTNSLDDLSGIDVAGGSYLSLISIVALVTGAPSIGLEECDSGAAYASATYSITTNTNYYLKILRDESAGTYGTLYCYIYSDAARTTLLTTLSIALHTSKKDYRYLFAAQSHNDPTAGPQISGYVENLERLANDLKPVVLTGNATSIASTTATGNGSIYSIGEAAVTQHGHCWATTANPTTADSKTTNGAGAVGAFTSAITGLTPGTTYYVRAYATNSFGTGYGSNNVFTAGDNRSNRPRLSIGIKSNKLHHIGQDGIEYEETGTAV